MKLLAAILSCCLFSLLPCHSGEDARQAPLHVFHHENVLGTSLELKIGAASGTGAEEAGAAALAEIDRLARILSSYDPASEFSAWAKTSGQAVRVSPELFEVLGLFDQWRERTGGALDASAEAIGRLWKNAAAEKRLPAETEIAAAVKSARQPHWRLDLKNRTATHLDHVPLVLNSFTKSYIASRAADAVLARPQIRAVVVNIGGDIVVRGALTEPVDITSPKADAENDRPLARIAVNNRTVATSGSYRRGVEIAGHRYSHIVDPRSGRPVDHILSATVISENAAQAGALATALCVLPADEGLKLAGSIAGVECLLITRDGTRHASRGWAAYEAPRLQLAAAGEAAGWLAPAAGAIDAARWDAAMELVVSLELARMEGQRYKRPYVAVWIEDKDKFPVRTLALWIAKPKWLPDLKSWMHSEKLRALTEGNDLSASVSSATRSPGKYTLKWDGKDDHGHPVKPGKYTVFIEAAREHGTHQVMKQEMDFSGQPQRLELKGNIEVSAATLDYRRKADAR